MNTKCIPWTRAKDKKGYGRVHVKALGKTVLSHRLAYCVYNNIQLSEIGGLVIRHKCDNPSCVNPEHLEAGTQKDNMQDAIKRNRAVNPPKNFGENNVNVKISLSIANEIRKTYVPRSKEFGSYALARKYGVHRSLIGQIVKNKIWKAEVLK